MPKRVTKKIKPLWKGPEVEGISQSMIAGFLICKERFRIRNIEGWAPISQFSAPLEYGSMWQICEEFYAKSKDTQLWREKLREYAQQLLEKYPDNRQEVDKWYSICLRQFPQYIHHWDGHKESKNAVPLLQEYKFCIPYKLPSGRVVKLRGMMDGVDKIGKGIWLQENKAKGNVDQEKLARQLTFDLQTMTYLTALISYKDFLKEGSSDEHIPDYMKLPGNVLNSLVKLPVKGVRYNVVRRPLSGGLHSIRKREGRMVNAKGLDGKPVKGPDGKNMKTRVGVESFEDFYNRLETVIEENRQDFFYRWKVAVTTKDLQDFKDTFLNPCLEHICQWYDYITDGVVVPLDPMCLHYRLPYGIYNPIMERGSSDFEEYLMTGSTVGLKKVKYLFPELQ